MNYLQLLQLALPEAILVAAALLVLGFGLTKYRGSGFETVIACAGLVTAAVSFFWMPRMADFGEGMLLVSPLASLFQIVCLALAFFTVLLAAGKLGYAHHAEFLGLVLFATVGLMLLVGSEELLMIFIGLELTGLSLYVMAGFDKRDHRSAEAGLKYFLFGSTASAFTLFGLSLVYGSSGQTNLPAIAASVASGPAQPLLVAGIVMSLAGFLFKIAAAPFHLWAPDIYEGGPVVSVAFIASASKVASFFVLGKIVLLGFPALSGGAGWHAMVVGWKPVLAATAALSILVGNFVALAQSDVRRLLAYSAVAHAGYTLLGLVAGGRDGFSATLFYSTIYAFTLVGAFGVVGIIERETGRTDFRNFRGLRWRSPFLTAAMSFFLLSLAGLPPSPGFFGKFYLFSAALNSGGRSTALLWLVGLALFGSLVSLYYYLGLMKTMLVDDGDPISAPLPSSGWERMAVGVLAGLVVALGLWPNLLLRPITDALG